MPIMELAFDTRCAGTLLCSWNEYCLVLTQRANYSEVVCSKYMYLLTVVHSTFLIVDV